ncbi:kinesin-like protein KIF22 [Anabrus simplex]|uniref:kinesin-like protein KIF22 n=1 Tax=Anabrus simplex TaxID=316456 RepID=UPI0034DCD1C0
MSSTSLRGTTGSHKPTENSTGGKVLPVDDVEITPVQRRMSTTTRRRTTRLHKPKEHDAGDSPARPDKASSKRKSNKPKGRNILQQEHNALILSVLNSDNPREIERLPTIGPKTAMIIFNYRRLNGQFTSIEDLKKVVGLHKNYYNRFIAANSIVV